MPASLELVRIALQAYGAGDVEIALALSDPMIRWDERASRPDGELVWGQDDVAKAMRRYRESWESYSFELEDIAEVAPGKVVGICRERGTSREGVPVDRRFGGLWLVEGTRIASWSTYLTPKEAVRAARELVASEPPPKPPAAAPPARPERPPPAAQVKPLRAPSEEQRRAAKARAQMQRQAGRLAS